MGLVSWVKDKASSVSDGAQNAWDSAVDKAKSVDLKAAGHMALDVAGMVPVVGAAADVANAGWYAAEGDWTNAALSAAGAVPGIGDAATAAKLGKKAVTGAQALAKTNKAANAATTTTAAVKATPTSAAKTPTTAGTKTTPATVPAGTKTAPKPASATAGTKTAPKPATASGAKSQPSGASSKPAAGSSSKPAGSNETPSAAGGGKSGGNGPTDRTGKAPGADADGPNGSNEPNAPRPKLSAKERRAADRARTEQDQRGADAYGGRDTDGDMPGSNQAQNRQFDHLGDRYNLNTRQRDEVHRQLKKEGGHHSPREVEDIMKSIADRDGNNY